MHILPVVAVCDRDRNKTAAGADLPGPAPASRTPLQSPHFLVVVKQADCAVYNVRSGLWPALYVAGKYADEEN